MKLGSKGLPLVMLLAILLSPVSSGVLSVVFNQFGTYSLDKKNILEGQLTEARRYPNYRFVSVADQQIYFLTFKEKNQNDEDIHFSFLAVLSEPPTQLIGKQVVLEYVHASPKMMLIIGDPDPLGGFPQIYLRGDAINYGPPVIYGKIMLLRNRLR